MNYELLVYKLKTDVPNTMVPISYGFNKNESCMIMAWIAAYRFEMDGESIYEIAISYPSDRGYVVEAKTNSPMDKMPERFCMMLEGEFGPGFNGDIVQDDDEQAEWITDAIDSVLQVQS